MITATRYSMSWHMGNKARDPRAPDPSPNQAGQRPRGRPNGEGQPALAGIEAPSKPSTS